MSYSELILRDSAEIVWPFDDITESSSISRPINFFTDNPYAYSASINTFNTTVTHNPIVFGGGSVLSLSSSNIGMSIPALGRFSELYSGIDSSLSLWFQTGSLFSGEYPIFKKRNYENIGLFIKDNYLIFRYGTTASYVEVASDMVDLSEPTHVVVSKTFSGLSITINGSQFNTFTGVPVIEKDPQHTENDYIDFYGPPQNYWTVDSIALYPNAISTTVAKRHYVYGLGKTVTDDVFYTRGGNFYNLSTIPTEKIIDINWDYKEEWQLTDLVDLSLESDGIRSIPYSNPVLYSFDNNIDTSSNNISFYKSGSVTQASYIDIDRLYNKIGGGEYPFFVKFKLDGQLPYPYLSQRLISYGKFPDNEIINFDLYNDNNTYKVIANIPGSASASFPISNISSSPSFYIGMKFSGNTTIFFAQESASVQSASFNYINSDGYGIDPLTPYFPPSADISLRIGSSLNYNEFSFTDSVYDVSQFNGSFERFLIVQKDFSASSTFQDLDNYKKNRYKFIYDSNKNRFKVSSYGYGSFNIHSVNFSEYISDNEQKLYANLVKIGYPDISSASQVYFYTTHLSYSGSVLYPKTSLSQINYLPFINNRNVSDSYLKFDFEIYSEDCINYPPKIKYFQMQTFNSTQEYLSMRDDAGPDYILYATSSTVYLPEIRYTPSIFMTDKSGIKLSNTIADFTEKIMGKPLDPTTINGLKLWLDARFVNGLAVPGLEDDSRVMVWSDLSGNNNNAIQNISASAPIFRSQCLNILRSNQLNGSDTDDTSFIIGNNLLVESSPAAVIIGVKGIKATPNGSSIDSYIDLSFNTASLSTFPNQSYTIVGSLKMDKPQTASSLHANARKIIVYNTDGTVETLAASSNAATNSKGTYSLSATFSTDASTTRSIFRLYNGSYDFKDYSYWDNIGVYPITSGSSQNSWVIPLTGNDHPVVKFNGNNLSLVSSASTTQPSSLYIVARNFGSSCFVESTTASIIYSNSSSYFISYGSPKNYYGSNNSFHIFSIINNGSTTELYINGDYIDSQNSGTNPIDQLIIGRGLKGDIAAILLYEGVNSSEDRHKIENWLSESFNIPILIEEKPISYYSASYTNEY